MKDYEYRYEITENDGNFSSAVNFGPIISENSYCSTRFCESSVLHRSSSYDKKGYTLQVSIVVRNGPVELDPVTVVHDNLPRNTLLNYVYIRFEVKSPIYSSRNPVLPGTCYFTETGIACNTIYNFYCEGFFDQIGRIRSGF